MKSNILNDRIMKKIINFKNMKFVYNVLGNGNAIVLLHGYLESKEIWTQFGMLLSEKFKVIIPDLPGHGESESFHPANTMELMAGLVKEILLNENVLKAFIIGHSMGGYAAMAFADLFPDYMSALSLFHSTPFADSEEKKKNRDREIELLRQGKKKLIYSNHFPKVFAKRNEAKFKNRIEEAKLIASNLAEEFIISTLEGMKQRKDYSEVLKNLKVAFLYVTGKGDQFIPYDLRHQLNYPKDYEIMELEKSGHIGFVEEEAKAFALLLSFIQNQVYKD